MSIYSYNKNTIRDRKVNSELETDRSDKKGPETRVIGNTIIKKYMIFSNRFILFEIIFIILLNSKNHFLNDYYSFLSF